MKPVDVIEKLKKIGDMASRRGAVVKLVVGDYDGYANGNVHQKLRPGQFGIEIFFGGYSSAWKFDEDTDWDAVFDRFDVARAHRLFGWSESQPVDMVFEEQKGTSDEN